MNCSPSSGHRAVPIPGIDGSHDRIASAVTGLVRSGKKAVGFFPLVQGVNRNIKRPGRMMSGPAQRLLIAQFSGFFLLLSLWSVLVTLSRCPRWVLVTLAGDFLLLGILFDCLLHQLTGQTGPAGGFAEQLVQLRVLVAVDFHFDLEDVFSFPGNFALGIGY